MNLEGQTHGRLTIIKRARIISPRTFWICQCSCDDMYIVVMGKNITSKKVQSCGCLRRDVGRKKAAANSILNTLPAGEAGFNQMYAVYRFHANERNLPFELTKEEFKTITKKNCHYCGVEPLQEYCPRMKSGAYIYNGIDRLENKLGYTKDNSVPCCGICNDMKRTRSVTEFITACGAVAKHCRGLL
jgi:hypothetical protein